MALRKDTYRGDSAFKKSARLEYWLRAMHEVGEERFVKQRFLGLAGREAADAKCLVGIGVPPKNIVLAERSSSAARQARAAAPEGVVVEEGDVLSVAKRPMYRRTFDHVLLDFCSPLCQALILLVGRVGGAALKREGTVGAAFMFGRERDLDGNLGKSFVEIGRAYQELYSGPDDPHPAYRSRAWALFHFLGWSLIDNNLVAWATFATGYMSGSARRKGVPMIYMQCHARRPFRRVKRSVRRRQMQRYAKSFFDVDTGYRLDLSDAERQLKRDVLMFSECVDSGSERAALLFNVSPGTVRAWKAHATRGTYGFDVQTEMLGLMERHPPGRGGGKAVAKRRSGGVLLDQEGTTK